MFRDPELRVSQRVLRRLECEKFGGAEFNNRAHKLLDHWQILRT